MYSKINDVCTILGMILYIFVAKGAIAADLHFGVGGQAPYFIQENGKLTGACGEIYQELKSGLIAQNITVSIEKPIVEEDVLFRQLLLGNLDVVCAEERDSTYRGSFIYSIRPVFEASEVLVTHKDDTITPTGHEQFQYNDFEILAVQGSRSAKFIHLLDGLVVNTSYKKLDNILALIAIKPQHKFLYHIDMEVVHALKKEKLDIRIVPVNYRKIQFWLLYSRDVNFNHIDQLEKILLRLEIQGRLKEIELKYSEIPG